MMKNQRFLRRLALSALFCQKSGYGGNPAQPAKQKYPPGTVTAGRTRTRNPQQIIPQTPAGKPEPLYITICSAGPLQIMPGPVAAAAVCYFVSFILKKDKFVIDSVYLLCYSMFRYKIQARRQGKTHVRCVPHAGNPHNKNLLLGGTKPC